MTAWKRSSAALLVTALALTGCGRDSGGGDEASSQANGISAGPATGTVTVWAMGTEGEKLGVLAKDFEAANPDVDIKITPVPWESAHDKIATSIAGRKTPDMSLIGTTWMGEFANAGALDPTPSSFDKTGFFPGAWDSTVVNDTSYGVPWYVETRLIYYRTDLAKKAGVQPPTTWSEMKDFAKALQDKGGAKNGFYLQPGQTGAWQSFMPFAWQAGAELTNADSTQFTLDSPEMTKALDFYTSFFDEGLSPKGLVPAVEQPFIDGKTGAFISGPWHMGILRDVAGKSFDSKWDVAPMPKDQAGTSFVGGGDLAVFKTAKNRDAAWKFVEYLSKPEVQAKWYKTMGDLPAVKSSWQDPEIAGDERLAKFGDQLNDAKSPPAVPTWEQVAAGVDTEIEKAVKTGESSADAVKRMQNKAESIGTGL